MPSREDTFFAYVNRERTHEVLASAEPVASGYVWSVTERPTGSRDLSDALVLEERIQPDVLPRRVADLETRLALSGEYFRLDITVGRPMPLPPPPRIDLRAHTVPLENGKPMSYFHFHREHALSRLLLAAPRDDGPRFAVATYDFDVDHPGDGKLVLVHPRLAPEMVVSRVAGDHLDLPRRGFRKLYEPQEYREALGESWRERASRILRAAAAVISRPARPGPVAEAPPVPLTATKKDPATLLTAPAYLSVRKTWVKPEDDALLVEQGVHQILVFMRDLRRRASHAEQARLSLLEAGLYVEHGLRERSNRLVSEYAPQLERLAEIFAYTGRR